MVFCCSNVRAVRNRRAVPFGVQIPTQKLGKGLFGVARDNHRTVDITKRYRLRRQSGCTIHRTAVQFIGNRISFALPNRIQGMISLRFRNNRFRCDIIALAICFRVPPNKGIALVFHFHSGQLAISFAGRDFNVFRIINNRSEIQIKANCNLFGFIAALTTRQRQNKRKKHCND